MPTNTIQLYALVAAADPTMSDADLAAQLSTPIITPKTGLVTYTTLGGKWGTSAAATFRAGLQQAIAAGGSFGAVAAYIDTLLSGPGIDPSDAEVPTQSDAFVAAGLATQDQVNGVFFDITYPAGDVVQASDVTAARAYLAGQKTIASIRSVLALIVNDWITQQPTVPTAAAVISQVQSQLAAAGVS